MTTAQIEPDQMVEAFPEPFPTSAGSSAIPASVSSPGVGVGQAIEAVALHVASTSLSPRASLAHREKVRAQWAAHLVAADACRHPEWHVIYLPGMTFNDGETWAVHRSSGRVVGGDCPSTGQHHNESTQDWLDRL